MAKTLSLATVIEKNRLSSDVPFLLLLDIDVVSPASGAVVEVLHYARNTEEVLFDGKTYKPATFDFELREESGSTSTVKLTIQDHQRIVQARMQDHQGGVGFGVTLTVANGAALDKPPEVQEFFEVVGAESGNYVVSFSLGAENTLTKAFPRRRQTRDYCQWRYKGVEGGYSGVMATCDLTRTGANGCEAHNNVIRFGAFPGINASNVRYG